MAGLLNTHVVPTIVHLDPDPATDDGTWLKQTVVYAADAACEADLTRVLDAGLGPLQRTCAAPMQASTGHGILAEFLTFVTVVVLEASWRGLEDDRRTHPSSM